MKQIFLAVVLVLVLSMQAVAQRPSANAAADQAWADLKAAVKAPTVPTPVTPNAPKTLAPSKAEQAAKYIAQANQLQSFYQSNPTHSAVHEAKQLETVALCFAAMNGDMTQDQRRTKLVSDAKADLALAVGQRFEVSAWNAQVAISRQILPTRAARLAAQETASRSLIAEFSTYGGGYESLLAIARDSAPDRGQVIARDLLAMPAASPAIKADAQLLLDRLALVGQPLPRVAAQALLPVPVTKPVLVYSWTSDNPASLRAAHRLATFAPKVALVGINLDANPTTARQTAATEKLPGTQTYDPTGAGGPLATALKLGRSSQVYLLDAGGVTRDVQALEGTAEKLAQLSR